MVKFFRIFFGVCLLILAGIAYSESSPEWAKSCELEASKFIDSKIYTNLLVQKRKVTDGVLVSLRFDKRATHGLVYLICHVFEDRLIFLSFPYQRGEEAEISFNAELTLDLLSANSMSSAQLIGDQSFSKNIAGVWVAEEKSMGLESNTTKLSPIK